MEKKAYQLLLYDITTDIHLVQILVQISSATELTLRDRNPSQLKKRVRISRF